MASRFAKGKVHAVQVYNSLMMYWAYIPTLGRMQTYPYKIHTNLINQLTEIIEVNSSFGALVSY